MDVHFELILLHLVARLDAAVDGALVVAVKCYRSACPFVDACAAVVGLESDDDASYSLLEFDLVELVVVVVVVEKALGESSSDSDIVERRQAAAAAVMLKFVKNKI